MRSAEHIVHVDMDAFFVEVERLRDPGLRDKPVIVGGLGGRGVVASASYEARQYGVRSAMPMSQARRQCPHARFLPPDHRRYRQTSREVFALLRGFTPFVEELSVDEAFLDVAGLRFHYEDARAVGLAIREEIKNVIGLPASVGIARTKFLAKLASNQAKPDGLLAVPAGGEQAFLDPLPIDHLWGVGAATKAALEELGTHTIGDLARLPDHVVERRLGEAVGRQLAGLARGEDPRLVTPDRATKSVSVEETYEKDLLTAEGIRAQLRVLCDRLTHRLRSSGLAGRTVTLKVRFANFETLSRSLTLAEPAAGADEIRAIGSQLLSRIPRQGRAVRLLGIAMSGLVTEVEPTQLRLEEPTRDALAVATDQARERYGDDAVIPARQLES